MEEYATMKIELLNDFQIELTQSDKKRIMNAKSIGEIDRIARDLLQPYDI